MPPHLVPPPFAGPYDSAPSPAPPPSDPELVKCIDKLVEYTAKNGPDFEDMIRLKQKDNPAYSFLFGGEGHNYYRYKLWLSTRPPGAGGPFNPPFPSSPMSMMHPSPMMKQTLLNAPPLNTPGAVPGASASLLGTPQMHQPPFPPFFEQQHLQQSQPFGGHGRSDYDKSGRPFKGLSGPLPADVAMELNSVLNNLTGTKESIKGAKSWFMQRSPFAPALAEAIRDRVFALDDSDRQMHIIYLANDILFDSLQRRINPHDLDNESLAFKPILGSMLARIYHNPQNMEENQSRLQKILQFWATKEVYDHDTIHGLEADMIGGQPTDSFPGPHHDLPVAASVDFFPGAANLSVPQWQTDKQSSSVLNQELPDKQASSVPAMPPNLATHQFLPNSATPRVFVGSVPQSSSVPPANQPQVNSGEKVPPYPLFPPGLIPGMVRKMQIGSGVPYCPMSPLDIPTVIPPSTVSPSEVLKRVSKFFKEIGEVNPSEGPMGSADGNDDDEDDYEREPPIRKGGACIPPPMNLQVEPEGGPHAEVVADRKPVSSGSGRLGLGAIANPNEVSQYDDVYSSYRKQRSTTYHSSLSTRATAR